MEIRIRLCAILALYITTINATPCPDDCTDPNHGTCDPMTGECNCMPGYSHSDYIDNCAGIALESFFIKQ